MSIPRFLRLISRPRSQRILLVVGFGLLLLTSWLWWHSVYTNPVRVFEGMLRQNLATTGYTRITSQDNRNAVIERTSQIQLGSNPGIQTREVATQGDLRAVAEYITTLDETYGRVIEYPDDSFDGRWVQLPSGSAFNSEVVEYTFFPMGFLSAVDRNEILDFISEHNIYSVNYQDVQHETINGKQVYSYDVSVPLQSYAVMLQKFSGRLGLTEFASQIDPAAYAGAEPYQLKVSVDRFSRQLIQVRSFDASATTENYSGYGIASQRIVPPDDFSSTQDLQVEQ